MKTIYFVHDQEESPAVRQNFLEMAGYQVKLLSSSRDLFVALKEKKPDLILMDVLIDGRNGFEACAEINSGLGAKRIPTILCSRIYRGRTFRDEALKLGAADYVLLPVNLDELVKRVNNVLQAVSGSEAAA